MPRRRYSSSEDSSASDDSVDAKRRDKISFKNLNINELYEFHQIEKSYFAGP